MNTWRRAIVPLVVVAIFAYCTYVSFHVVAYRILFVAGLRAAAIALWCILALALPLIGVYWGVILLRGPGKLPEELLLLPGLESGEFLSFLCDLLGFPLYCSHCQRLKPERSFHLSIVGVCVPRYDHYCVWLGAVVGRDNLVPFLKFVQLVAVYSFMSFCYAAVCIKRAVGDETLLPHILIVLVLTFFMGFMLAGLWITTTMQMAQATTTLDVLTKKNAATYKRSLAVENPSWLRKALVPPPRRFEDGVRYVNVQDGDSRAVVSYHVTETPYSFGVSANMVHAFLHFNNLRDGSPTRVISGSEAFQVWLLYFLPIIDLYYWNRLAKSDANTYESYSDDFGVSFMEQVQQKLEKGDSVKPNYIPDPTLQPKQSLNN
ncbi:hypothetical protein PUMCH_004040 [Australozyma saopauloensis]|uniref:Palmitoyltransferase n=1 Tax=Australozyma saopauloensis TaxID=291208 RepID=A0AAX4HDR0_9ASCO|nr:hypothetical protein PUMCH_004040 [[Candida] saopauloensis]